MNRRIFSLFLALTCLAWQGVSYTLNGSGGLLFRWPTGAQITYVTNSRLNPSHPGELTRGSLVRAFTAWNNVLRDSNINVRFVDGGNTDSNAAACDQVNTVSFTVTVDPPLPSGVLAVAQTYTAPVAGLIGGCGPNITTTLAGQIIDADMIFNTAFVFATDGSAGNDLEPVVLHEAGHMLGLHHSGLASAIMFPSEGKGALRSLTIDDIAGINAVYGVNAPGGSITGKITDGLLGVLGAHVVATNNSTGMTAVSVLSGVDGSYTIVGLVPGRYDVLAEPLDGPTNLVGNFPERFQAGRTDFSTVFSSGPVNVSSGQPATLNLAVGAKTMNLTGSMAVIQQDGSGASSGGALSVRRGAKLELCFGGPTISGDLTLSVPSSKAVPAPATKDCSAVPGMRGRIFNIAADTPVGVYDVRLPAAALPGYLRITANPGVPGNGVVDAAAGNPTYAPGSIISIYGTDLAPSEAFAASLPLPTQLNGISVMAGDRFAPLYYVSPGQVNAMVPFEVSGNVDVQVIGGSFSMSSKVRINLSSSAPRIFATNGAGTGQGAILDPQNNLVDASHPTTAGNVVVIYLQGLGPTSTPVISGVASPAAQISGTIRVTIGGKDSPSIQYKGLAPGFVGLYQVNCQVPAGVTAGNSVAVQVFDPSGQPSNTVTIAVR